MKLWYLSNLMKRVKCSNLKINVTENQHTIKVQTQTGMWDSINSAILPSGNYKNYYHVLTSNSTNAKHISGEQFSCNHVTMQPYIIFFQVEIKQMGILLKDFRPLTNTPDYTLSTVPHPKKNDMISFFSAFPHAVHNFSQNSIIKNNFANLKIYKINKFQVPKNLTTIMHTMSNSHNQNLLGTSEVICSD